MDQIVRMIDSASSNDVTYLLLSVISAVLVIGILARILAILARVHATLGRLKKRIEDASEQEREALDNLQKAVSGESESSLLSQAQKLRTDFSTQKYGQYELIREFRQFAETMAENNPKALIESLAKVIRDSNVQLNEQFGENFKQLSQTVDAFITPTPIQSSLKTPEPTPSSPPKPAAAPEQEPETEAPRTIEKPNYNDSLLESINERMADETVRPAGQKEHDFATSSPPEFDSKIVLDAERVAPVTANTERVSSVLGDIFRGEDPEVDQEATLEDAGDTFSGLDAQHVAFLRVLLTKPHWEEVELETLAKQFQLMWEGALETVNEWSFQRFDDVFIEKDEGYYEINLDPDIITQLQE